MIGREAELERLRNLLYDVPLLGASFVALTGEKGIGKTTLLRYFIQNLPDWTDGILVQFSPSREEFFLQIGRYLKSDETEPSRISIKFHNFLERRRTPFVLAIDDVDTSYGFLLNFFGSLRTYQVLLVAALSGGDVPSYFEDVRLKPWTTDEIREFYRQNKGVEPSIATLVEIEVATGGIPGKCRDFLSGRLKGLSEKEKKIEDDDPDSLKKKALQLQAQGRFEEALRVYKKLIDRIDSPRERARLKLSIVSNWSLTPDDLLRILNTIDRGLLDGEDVFQFELLRAYVYSQMLEFQKAIEVLDDFLKKVKGDKWYANALALRGEARYHLGDIERAEEDFKEVVRVWQMDDEIRFMAFRGLALINMYRLYYDRAMASIRRMDAIALSLKNLSLIQISRTLRASTLAKMGKLKEAECIFYDTIKLLKNAGMNYSYPFFNSLHVYMIKHDFKSVIHNINHMLKSGIPGVSKNFILSFLHLDLAKAYLEIGDIGRAEEHLNRFKTLMPPRHAWERIVENIERRLKVERGEKVFVKLSKRLTADEIEKRIIRNMVLAMEGKKSSARRGFVSLVRKLEKRNAYDWLMKTVYIAIRFFPHDPEFTRFLRSPEKRREKFGLYVLGPYKIIDFSTNIQVYNDLLKSVKLREFLSIIVLAPIITRDGRLSRFFIKERLWPYFEEERQNKNLSWVISRFREIFGRDGIVKEGDFYRLNTDVIYVDVSDFLKFYHNGREADRKGKDFLALDNYSSAVNLVFGRPFEGLPVESCEDTYQALMGMIEYSFERVCEISLMIGKTREVRELSEFARNIFPFNENFYRYPVRSYLIEGRKLRARKEFQIMKRIYESEFGESFSMDIP